MLSITNEIKNAIAVTNESRTGQSITWDEATFTWDAATGTWDSPRVVLTQASKNSLSISNEAKP